MFRGHDVPRDVTALGEEGRKGVRRVGSEVGSEIVRERGRERER